MARQKSEAERLRIGVRGGWIDSREVMAWADREIDQTPQPHPSLIDVASASNAHREELATLLDAIPGSFDRVAVMRSCLADLLEVVEHQPRLAVEVATWIEAAASRGELTEADFGLEPFALVDAFDLAAQGRSGTVDEARDRLVAFLQQHARRGT